MTWFPIEYETPLSFSCFPMSYPTLKDIVFLFVLQVSPQLAPEGVQLFRNVTGYMGDRESSKSPLDHVQKIIRTLLNAPMELRDEIYCQV
jgi:hypothetical protein